MSTSTHQPMAPVPATAHIRLVGVPAYDPTDADVEPGEAA